MWASVEREGIAQGRSGGEGGGIGELYGEGMVGGERMVCV